jgi:sulfoxide reductase catalytic subunit YedY
MRPRQSILIKPSEITPESVYLSRRQLLAGSFAAAAALSFPAGAVVPAGDRLTYTRNAKLSVTDAPNTYEDITTYNNFYEFGTDKADAAANSHKLRTQPWSVTIAGEAEITGKFTLEDVLEPHALEERIYRLRCVERGDGIPWVGFPLRDLIRRFKPTSKAKYVAFKTLFDPKQMPGQRYAVLDWPYVEGLRMDEAMHPLTLMVVGLYGHIVPNQNGAPLRLVVQWKYGFKGIKSIVEIRFTERQPLTSWNLAAPNEYGFYANVNPEVDHPRWSQARERRIGSTLFAARQPSLMFNGYAAEVASLYRGMDLRKYY